MHWVRWCFRDLRSFYLQFHFVVAGLIASFYTLSSYFLSVHVVSFLAWHLSGMILLSNYCPANEMLGNNSSILHSFLDVIILFENGVLFICSIFWSITFFSFSSKQAVTINNHTNHVHVHVWKMVYKLRTKYLRFAPVGHANDRAQDDAWGLSAHGGVDMDMALAWHGMVPITMVIMYIGYIIDIGDNLLLL